MPPSSFRACLMTPLALCALLAPVNAAEKTLWALQPVVHKNPPAVHAKAVNAIDAFILAKLEAAGIKASAEADRLTLLRRVTFDLIGLPPTPEEVDAFLADKSPAAYEKVVDRLLASQHYGERWARHWLDIARYAESEGFKSDETRPNAWRYRDYVIAAFNTNKPYDRFVKEQLAGDELWPGNPEAHIATGFNRHYPDESNARNLMQRRQEILDDITDTVGSAFLGLTYGCARCHDHKFDPILHKDYYRLQAFFANTAADDQIPLLTGDELAAYRRKKADWEKQTEPIRTAMAGVLAPAKAAIVKDNVDKFPPEIQSVISMPASERNPYQWQMYYKAKPYMEVDNLTASKSLRGEKKKQYEELMKQLSAYSASDPGELPTGIGVHDVSALAPETHILRVGAYDAPLDQVEPGFLSALNPAAAKIVPMASSTGRRSVLANWIASPDNPLTARVFVNRLWHYHFGQGIAPSPSDFGSMGGRPTHPELLDWLSSEFTSTGWDVKRMQKLMVMSATYRQSSSFDEMASRQDARNKLLWRYPRQRLEGEVIRDSALAVAGVLNERTGGPSVYPALPAGAGKPRGGWKTETDPAAANRRSVYIFVRRNARYPMMEAFDMPDTHESCGRRNMTITAPQAMALLNDATAYDWAKAFAARVARQAGPDLTAEIETAYRLAYGRKPDAFEKDTVQTFFSKQSQVVASRDTVLVDFCHMLLNSNEFVYRN